MLFAVAVVLFVAWALGFFIFHVTTAVFHLLLLAAIAAIVFHFVSHRHATV